MNMNYKQMIDTARSKGISSEKVMIASVNDVDELLHEMKESHPDEYWKFLRQTHEHLYGCHYDDEFAKYDVSMMHSTDSGGKVYDGAHWTKSEVMAATANKTFSQGTTECDKYVAYNAMWHDLHKKFGETEIIEAAYLFYFADEDAPIGKVWKYMRALHS